ncbi:hypothetical protein GQ457_12G029750 [Hibiscus cannabinus]
MGYCLVEVWAQQVQCIVDKFPTTYLGLPLGFSRNSIELWNPVIEKFRKRLDGWKGKLLSFGGRITLLRSVFSNLPVYFMSLFQVPAGVAESLNKIMANFLWGPEAFGPIHWVKWENVCRAKVNGGLGWFEISTRNRSLLNNRVWRYGSEDGSLWRRVVDSKYDLDSMSLLPQPPEGRKTSWIWKNISKPLAGPSNNFVNAIRFKLGDGRRIIFWEDFLTEVPSLKLSFPRVFGLVLKKSGKVCEFGSKVEGKWIWSFKVRRALFSWEQAVWDEFIRIINKGAADSGTMDVLKWEHASNGVYSTKKLCELESALGSTEDKIWKLVWSGLAPPKVEGFLWKVILGRIPTLVELDKRGALHSSSTRCALCSRDEETVNHIFCLCEIGWKVWSKWVNEWRIRLVFPNSIKQLLQMWDSLPANRALKEFWRLSFFCILWTIWLCRNGVVFNNLVYNEQKIFEEMLLRLGFWCKGEWHTSTCSINEFVRNPVLIALEEFRCID